MKFRNLLETVREKRKEIDNNLNPHITARNILDQQEKDISNCNIILPDQPVSTYDWNKSVSKYDFSFVSILNPRCSSIINFAP